MGREQKMFRINLSNIPLSERSKKINALFGSKHTISEKDYLNLSLETTWRINGAGDEIPTFHIIMETDHNEKKRCLDLATFGAFGEYYLLRYRALLNIIDDERLSPNDFTFFDGFEKNDIKRIYYISMQVFGREYCLGRKHSDFLFDSMETVQLSEIILSEDEKEAAIMDIPAEYFDNGKVPIIPGEEDAPYLSIATFKYLVNNNILEKGTLSLESRNMLSDDEKAYIDWLDDTDSVKKPIINFSKGEGSKNVFERIFKKSSQDDLSLEF